MPGVLQMRDVSFFSFAPWRLWDLVGVGATSTISLPLCELRSMSRNVCAAQSSTASCSSPRRFGYVRAVLHRDRG